MPPASPATVDARRALPRAAGDRGAAMTRAAEIRLHRTSDVFVADHAYWAGGVLHASGSWRHRHGPDNCRERYYGASTRIFTPRELREVVFIDTSSVTA
jgi:hypothetical protein